MSDSVLEKAVAGAQSLAESLLAQDSTKLFAVVARGWPVQQAADGSALPACNVVVLTRRRLPRGQTAEKVKWRLLVGLVIRGIKTTPVERDQELNELVSQVEKGFENQRLGGVTGEVTGGEFDTSEFNDIPRGSRLFMVVADYTTIRGDPYDK